MIEAVMNMIVKYIVLKDTDAYADLERYVALLTSERQEKIARLRFERDKLRSLIAGLMILRETGGRPLVFGAHEKPYLADGSLYFSVSHSGDIVAIAVADTEIGLDVERYPDPDRLRIADRFYHPRERLAVEGAGDRVSAFTCIWTRKEAYLKMTGEGISADLSAFDTTAPPLSEQLCTVDLDGYSLSVCSAKRISETEIHISKIELNDLINE